jgi:hypothetical protein
MGRDPVPSNSVARKRLRSSGERGKDHELLTEELRIKDARLARLKPGTGARYEQHDRMAILELRAQRGWTQDETAKHFHMHPHTIGIWMKSLDDDGEAALTRIPEPANKLPEFVAYLVRRLKACAPKSGRKRIAPKLAREGLHVCPSTVRRKLKEAPPQPPESEPDPPIDEKQNTEETEAKQTTPRRQVAAHYPGHMINIDLTAVPTLMGLFTMLPPHALPQVWPFVWWVAFAVDHFSRRSLGCALFKKAPKSLQVRRFLGRALGRAGARIKSPRWSDHANQQVPLDLGPETSPIGGHSRRFRPRIRSAAVSVHRLAASLAVCILTRPCQEETAASLAHNGSSPATDSAPSCVSDSAPKIARVDGM